MDILQFGGNERGQRNDLFFYRLELIFSDADLKSHIRQWVTAHQWISEGMAHEVTLLKTLLLDISTSQQQYDQALSDLRAYVGEANQKRQSYSPQSRPHPSSFFWPNPRMGDEQIIYDVLPYMQTYPLIDRSTRIVSLGSCFASELAHELQARGYNYVVTEAPSDETRGVRSADHVHQDRAPFSAAWGLIFNTPSFRQLAEKAFGLKELPRILIKFEDYMRNKDLYFDPFRENMTFASRQAYEENYETHRQAARQALETADVMVLTFGLNECWEFLGSGAVSAMPPATEEMASIMRCRVLTVAENSANIQAFIDIVRRHNPRVKFIISVSPVPFKWTVHTDRHVIEANSHSKATLRVVAEEIVRANQEVYYLPSYETVTQCVRNPWESDQRHVTREAVSRVMTLVEKMFFRSDTIVSESPASSPLSFVSKNAAALP